MPDIHVPKLDGHGGGKSIFTLVLEVALISVGVFLGLAGEQWRENARHRELAEQALRRFRTEIIANRKAIVDVKDYHIDRLKELNQYFGAPLDQRKTVPLRLTKSVNPAFVEHTAWDLALATQSLSYIDTDLAYTLSSIYNVQAVMQDEGRGFLQAMFIKPPAQDPSSFFGALQAYFGDASLLEPRLLTLYDEALQRIGKVLGEAPEKK